MTCYPAPIDEAFTKADEVDRLETELARAGRRENHLRADCERLERRIAILETDQTRIKLLEAKYRAALGYIIAKGDNRTKLQLDDYFERTIA